MIIFDSKKYCFRVVSDEHNLKQGEQIVLREDVRQRFLEQLDECGFASMLEPHQCCNEHQ